MKFITLIAISLEYTILAEIDSGVGFSKIQPKFDTAVQKALTEASNTSGKSDTAVDFAKSKDKTKFSFMIVITCNFPMTLFSSTRS